MVNGYLNFALAETDGALARFAVTRGDERACSVSGQGVLMLEARLLIFVPMFVPSVVNAVMTASATSAAATAYSDNSRPVSSWKNLLIIFVCSFVQKVECR